MLEPREEEGTDDESSSSGFEMRERDSEESPPPVDRQRRVYWLHLALGIGILFPFNAFVSAVDYFNALYPELNPAFIFSTAYMLPNFLTFFPVLRWAKRLSFSTRIVGSFVLYFFILGLAPFIALQTSLGESAFFITVALVFLCGATDALVQGALYGFSALFPHEYTSSVQTGTGIAGTVVVGLRMITKASFDDDLDGLRNSAIAYFVMCAMWMAVCAIAFVVMKRNPFAQYYLRGGIEHGEAIALDAKEHRALLDVSLLSIFRRIWSLAGLECMQFTISLALYPGVLSMIPSQSWGLDQSWLTVWFLSLFSGFHQGRNC
jgi:solute carrier family 29 (equilibrative nucleoside transporter), member 1/2/3